MRILFVASEIPYPPDNGVRIVSHHAMRLMAEEGHKLGLAVLTEEKGNLEERLEYAANLCEPGCATLLSLPKRNRVIVFAKSLWYRRLFFMERYRYGLFREKLKQLVNDFCPDVIHFDTILMTQYRDVAAKGVGTVASINDSYALFVHNRLQSGQYCGIRKFYREKQYRQACKYEANVYPKFGITHTMTDVDANYMRKFNPAIRTTSIPNGVDQSLFGVAEQTLGLSDLIFVGTLLADGIDNLNGFLRQSWPIVRTSFPQLTLHVVGRMGPQIKATQRLAEQIGGVVFHGYQEDLTKIYRRCGIAVVPVNKNCGIVNKAIEAMAAGLAVVGFDKTFAGIPQAQTGINCVSAADYDGFGHAITGLVSNTDERVAIQRSAHIMAKRYYSWNTRSGKYSAMYAQALEIAGVQA